MRGEREEGTQKKGSFSTSCFLLSVNEATWTESIVANEQGNAQLNFMKHQFHSFSLILLQVSNNCYTHCDYAFSRSPGLPPHEKITLLPFSLQESGEDMSRTNISGSHSPTGHVRGWGAPHLWFPTGTPPQPLSGYVLQNSGWRKNKRPKNW